MVLRRIARHLMISSSFDGKLSWPALLALVLLFVARPSSAQCDQDTYRLLFDGSGADVAHRTVVHANGDVYVAGFSDSYGSDSDLIIVRSQSDGTIVWAKRYDVVGDDGGLSMCFTAGASGSLYLGAALDGVGTNQEDGSLIKLDADGNVLWARRLLPMPFYCQVRAVAERPDGDVIIVGSVNSIGAGLADSFAARFNATGGLIWLNSYGWSGQDHFTDVELLPDGSFTACSQSMGPSASIRKAYIAHIAANGSVLGCTLFNGGVYDSFNHGVRNPDGSYLWVGYTDSYGAGGRDVLAILTDATGAPIWYRTFGTAGNEEGTNAVADPSGGWWIAAFQGSQRNAHLIRVLPGGVLDHVRALADLTVPSTALWAQLLEPASDGGLYFLGNDPSATSTGFALEKLNGCGLPGCTSSSVTWEMGEPIIPMLIPSLPISASSSNVDPVTVVAAEVTDVVSQDVDVVDCDSCSIALSGADIQACSGSLVLLQPSVVLGEPVTMSWQWELGDGTLSDSVGSVTHDYAQAGTYQVSVVVTDTSGSCSDTLFFQVEVIGPAQAMLGPDTVLCPGSTVILEVDPNATAIGWNDGSAGSSLAVSDPGTYWVSLELGGCATSDTVVVDQGTLPSVVASTDTTLCGSGVVQFTATGSSGDVFTWSDGTQGTTLVTSTPGTYTVTATSACGEAWDDVVLRVSAPYQHPAVVHTCPERAIEWELPVGSTEIVWSNGETSPNVDLEVGSYTYHFVDAAGCYQEGQLVVAVDISSDGYYYVPNVFTPNGDGVNDSFEVVGAEHDGFEFSIFNRWGELIFETIDADKAWDGSCLGASVPDGTYVYVVSCRDVCSGSVPKTSKGHVTLLR